MFPDLPRQQDTIICLLLPKLIENAVTKEIDGADEFSELRFRFSQLKLLVRVQQRWRLKEISPQTKGLVDSDGFQLGFFHMQRPQRKEWESNTEADFDDLMPLFPAAFYLNSWNRWAGKDNRYLGGLSEDGGLNDKLRALFFLRSLQFKCLTGSVTPNGSHYILYGFISLLVTAIKLWGYTLFSPSVLSKWF